MTEPNPNEQYKVSGGDWVKNRIADEAARFLREKLSYFTALPNMIDESDLDPYERTLLQHYYRVGTCWESNKTTAETCNMSVRTVRAKRKSLAEKGWVRIEGEHESGTVVVEVVDRWEENHNYYNGGRHLMPGGAARDAAKEDPVKKNTTAKRQNGDKSPSPNGDTPQALVSEQAGKGTQENGCSEQPKPKQNPLPMPQQEQGKQANRGETTTIRSSQKYDKGGRAEKRKGRAKKEWERVADDLGDWFEEHTSLSKPKSFGGYVKLWRKPLWRVVKLHNGDVGKAKSSIRRTVSDFWDRDNPLTIKSPLSLLATIESDVAQQRRANKTPMKVTEQGGVWA